LKLLAAEHLFLVTERFFERSAIVVAEKHVDGGKVGIGGEEELVRFVATRIANEDEKQRAAAARLGP